MRSRVSPHLHLPVRVLLAALAAALCAPVWPQAYPSKPIRMIVAFPPGGGTDIVARTLGAKLGESLGQQIVVENRAGAAGIVGTEIAAKSAPDGYTLFMGTMGNIAVNPVLYKNLPFDMARDLTPLTLVVSVAFVLYAHPALPVNNVKQLIALAKSRPEQITYASSGAGGAPHLAGSLFESMAGVKLVHIAYKGSGPAMTDLMGGHVSLEFDSMLQGLPYVKGGRLKALATLGPKRAPQLPDVPTVDETIPGYEVINWFGLVLPTATPREIVQRLNSEVVKALRSPEVRERLAQQGAEPVGNSPEEFGAFIKSESAKWAKVIRGAHIIAE